MIDEKDCETISKITSLYVKASEFENEIASDGLKFSLWAAALATAGFGLILLNAKNIALSSWLGKTVGLYILLANQVVLAVSIAAAGVMHVLVNARLRSEREATNLLNAQMAKVLSGQVSEVGHDIVASVTGGLYLSPHFQGVLNSTNQNTARLDKWIGRTATAQKVLVGIAYGSLLVVGTPSRS